MKYKFTGETKPHLGRTLHQIVCVTAFASIAAGDIGRQVVVNAGIATNGAVPKIGVVADPQACFIDVENPNTALYVEVELGDDWMLYEVFNDEHFVLLSEVAA